jgi:glucoamylase
MYKGQSAGSAQPLVWAHSEYIKLLRSAVDGKVFDCIPVVAERYGVMPGERKFNCNIEIFQTSRPVASIAAGKTLRVVDTARFRMLYTTDNWATSVTYQSHPVGYAGSYSDIHTTPGQAGKIVFTFYWPEQNKWLGRNFEVEVVATD